MYLGHLASQPQAVQAKPHVMPAGQNEAKFRRSPQHEQLELPQNLARAQFVQVIDD